MGMANTQYVFGPGVCWITPVTDAFGNTVANPAPVLIAGIQDVSLDLSAEIKELYGTNSFALVIGRGKQKSAIKVKNAQVFGSLWNRLFFGQTLNSGVYENYYDAVGVAVPTTPFQITPVTTFAANLHGTTPVFGYDLGVRDVDNLPLARVASGPVTRQYSLTTGVYTFAGADTGIKYFFGFNYTATASAPVGQTNMPIANLPMGYAPTFQFDMIIPFQGKVLTATFPNCMAGKLSLATKLDDFTYPEFDINAFAPGSAGIGTLAWSA